MALALGWLMMDALRAHWGLTRLESLVFSLAVGLNTLSLYVLLAGLLGQLTRFWVVVLPAVVATSMVGYRLARRPRVSTARATPVPKEMPVPNASWLSERWLWLASPLVLATVLGGLLPPVAFDVREYHLQVPKEFYQRGRIGFLPHNVYGNMPLGPQMLTLLAMVMSGSWWTGALVGKTLTALFVPLTAAALLAAGKRLFGRSAGVVAALLYVSTPWMTRVSTLGLVEGALAFYWFLSVTR